MLDSQPPFRLGRLKNNQITFEQVYGNGSHSLRKLEIQNLLNKPQIVKLESDLGDQVAFQLENENIKDLRLLLKNNLATNTVDWTNAVPQDISQFNQLFNYVNYIEQIELEPNQSLLFVIAFLPSIMANSNSARVDPAVFENVSGIVSFKSNGYTLDVDFKATVCQSILAADDLDTGLIFEDTVIGETYMKDVTLRNHSAIELYWKLNTYDLPLVRYPSSNTDDSTHMTDSWLQFVDASTFEVLDQQAPQLIPAFSHYTFRVIFTPKEVGKFDYDLQTENINDVTNIIQTKIHANIRSAVHKETLIVKSGSIIDFGDCIAGSWHLQHMVLQNISRSPIEIYFNAQMGEEVFFNKLDEEESSKPSIIGHEAHIFSLIDIGTTAKTYSSDPGHVSSSSDFSTTSHDEENSSVNSYTSTEHEMNMWDTYRHVLSQNYYPSVLDISDSSALIPTAHFIKEAFSQKEAKRKHTTKIEYMVLKPGVENTVQVSYRPALDKTSSVNAGQFIRQNFQIRIEYGPNKSTQPKEIKLVQCTAKICTSFVLATPQVINFGETDVGTQKSLPITITNQSEIYAHIGLEFDSKVLNCIQRELFIQPKSTVELKLDIYPRKVNANYKKQITLANYLNRENDQIIEVSSKNIDKHRVTFHSLFYRILTPSGANFLDFGPIALNSPAIRTFTLVNVRDASLLLGISTSSQNEIIIYTKNKERSAKRLVASATAISKSTTLIKTQDSTMSTSMLVTDTFVAQNHRTRLTNVQYASAAYLDLATVPHIRFPFIQHKRKVARNIVSDKSFQSKHLSSKRSENFEKLASSAKNNNTFCKTESPFMIATAINTHNIPAKVTVIKESTIITTVNDNNTKSVLTKQNSSDRKVKQEKNCLGITGTSSQLKKVQKNMDWSDIAGKSRVPLDDLISILEHGSLSRTPLFAKQSLEEQFVRYQLAWRTELERLVEKGEIVPTTLLQLNPNEEEEIIIVYTPKNQDSQSLTSKNAASISFHLIDFDQSVIATTETSEEDDEEADSEQQKKQYYRKEFIPALRKVIVRAQVVKTAMDLGQKNINFGNVYRNERHHKTIVLHNKHETPLLYTIKKSGSIASGDIHLGTGRYGVVRAFGKREIEFIFEPTMPGPFIEQLEVINIRDKEDSNVILLKAMVRRPDSFSVYSTSNELAFTNQCTLPKIEEEQVDDGGQIKKSAIEETITVTNITKQTKMFEVRVKPQGNTKENGENATTGNSWEFKAILNINQSQTNGLSKEEEEEIETLQQKLKIAQRKVQPEKIKKYNKKLAQLRKKDIQDTAVKEESIHTIVEKADREDQSQKLLVVANNENDTISSFTEERLQPGTLINNRTFEDNCILFSLEPNMSKSVSVHFMAIEVQKNQEGDSTQAPVLIPETIVKGLILIHEHKNVDVCKIIPFSAVLCTAHRSCMIDR